MGTIPCPGHYLLFVLLFVLLLVFYGAIVERWRLQEKNFWLAAGNEELLVSMLNYGILLLVLSQMSICIMMCRRRL